jgi:uncharacterized cupredoxin-like copper-binding protein
MVAATPGPASRIRSVLSTLWPVRAGALAFALLALASACGGGGRGTGAPATPVAPVDGELTVRAHEWGFDPEAIVLRQAEQVRIAFENDGTILHNFAVEDLVAGVVESKSTGPLTAGEGDVFVGAEAGQGGVLVFVPQAPGSYTFYCTVQGHRDLGMVGVLTVE